MKNQGISLISLIITIIVIIILAAIVIFTGLNTPDAANFAKFCQECDNVYSAVFNSYADLKAKYGVRNQTRTDEQIYFEVATGVDCTQYGGMTINTTTPATRSSGETVAAGENCQNLVVASNKAMPNKLPEVRQSNKAWYVTEDGRVFNANGYVYKNDGETGTYFTSNLHFVGTLPADNTDQNARATTIATALMSGDTTVSGLN